MRAADFARQDLQASTSAYIVSLHKRSIDASRPRGRRRPFAHLPSPSTDRARKRASFIFVPTRPPVCCSSGGAAQRRGAFSQRRLWGGLWRRRWLSSRSPSPAPSSHAHASAVRAGAELSGGEGALPAAAGRGTCASPCPPSPARQQQWRSGRGVLNTHTQTPAPLASIGGYGARPKTRSHRFAKQKVTTSCCRRLPRLPLQQKQTTARHC